MSADKGIYQVQDLLTVIVGAGRMPQGRSPPPRIDEESPNKKSRSNSPQEQERGYVTDLEDSPVNEEPELPATDITEKIYRFFQSPKG